jgi:anaerobic C4-dicarboxylate transporter
MELNFLKNIQKKMLKKYPKWLKMLGPKYKILLIQINGKQYLLFCVTGVISSETYVNIGIKNKEIK